MASPSFLFLIVLGLLTGQSFAIKFFLKASRYPAPKCIWNPVHKNALVIVTANVGTGDKQRVDIEIVDSSEQRNIYLNKKNISGETRLAVTSHSEGEIGVCFKNTVDTGTWRMTWHATTLLTAPTGVSQEQVSKLKRIVDLDVDIGAEAVDYK